MAVYDRWGNLIFHRKDAQVNNREQGWNPQGKVVAGVYIYLISYMDNGEEKTLYGSVTVID
ncbi:MAG: gliding motility-associated C-terminal domain-containing protein [Saprospiraceae bacterium]|nr:gliding motility-associated C-terminal domain-containing protein [Saprospiraceae bacterium]